MLLSLETDKSKNNSNKKPEDDLINNLNHLTNSTAPTTNNSNNNQNMDNIQDWLDDLLS